MIKKIINEISLYLSGKSKMNGLDFSFYLEDYLCDNYDQMYEEDPDLTEMLNENIPEICSIMEPGMEDGVFKDKLGEEINKITTLGKEKYWEMEKKKHETLK